MYIQITTKCNMHCEHCGFSCRKSGTDMSLKTFRQACELAREREEGIGLGGGEPTIHPRFEEFLGIAMMCIDYDSEQRVFLVTNGSNTNLSLRLASMAKAGIIIAALSQDEWHDPIDPAVVKAFTRTQPPNMSWSEDRSRDFREIRSVKIPIAVGRAHKLKGRTGLYTNQCLCDELFVNPVGELYWCACRTRQLGTVENPEFPDDYTPQECYRFYQKPVVAIDALGGTFH